MSDIVIVHSTDSTLNPYQFKATGWEVADDGQLVITDSEVQAAAAFAPGAWAAVFKADALSAST